MKVELKNDKYKRARGGPSRLLSISCSKCGSHLFDYQKDGIGMLKRTYLDRMVNPVLSMNGNLMCPKCKNLIGVPMIYKKEDRPAMRLVHGSFSKNIKKD